MTAVDTFLTSQLVVALIYLPTMVVGGCRSHDFHYCFVSMVCLAFRRSDGNRLDVSDSSASQSLGSLDQRSQSVHNSWFLAPPTNSVRLRSTARELVHPVPCRSTSILQVGL